jgi:hypothetical protein
MTLPLPGSSEWGQKASVDTVSTTIAVSDMPALPALNAQTTTAAHTAYRQPGTGFESLSRLW